jgi:hypothetical protein
MTKALAILFIMLALSVNAQNSFMGGMNQGVEAGDPLPIQMGVKAWWDASYGVNTTAVGRAQTWGDISGNNYVLNNYSNAAPTSGRFAQPPFTRSFSTNGFPSLALILPTGTSRPTPMMFSGAFPANMSGVDKPYTIMTLFATVTNASSTYAFVLQDLNATNSSNGFKFGITPLRGANQLRIESAGDTNRSIITRLTFTHGITISNYFYATATYDGVNGRAYANLNASPLTPYDSQGQATYNLLRLSGTVTTNNSTTDLNGQNYLTMMMFFDYAMTGSQVTNTINWYNNNRYRAF